ncbi:tRNA dihydrouridine synthase [Mangrovitalea sediminis]|uniref:tRNA dihydrouridine synthase n=1 Tax=Mangrovitalea sediminis TaxID=1982043 RepID=UPI000BE53FD7|nr:tRNA-dihydrouridine synthase [Mangrovitalea sediminis]
MRIILAPMEGLVDPITRDLITRLGGVDQCVTEFVRITNTLLPPKVFYRLAPELLTEGRTAAGTPVVVQLLGSDPVCMAENACQAAALGAPAIDVNFGCPAKTVNRHRGGAALLREPELMQRIVEALRQAVPKAIPVTAKMRLGYDDTALTLDCARALEAAGAAEITVHARTKVEGYRPPAHWHWLATIREAVSVPVVANGEIWTCDDYDTCRTVSGCDDVMLGRGLVARPDLARQIQRGRRHAPAEPLDWAGVTPLLREFFARMLATATPAQAAGRLKQWLTYLRQTYPAAAELFLQIKRSTEPEAIFSLIDKGAQHLPQTPYNRRDEIPLMDACG